MDTTPREPTPHEPDPRRPKPRDSNPKDPKPHPDHHFGACLDLAVALVNSEDRGAGTDRLLNLPAVADFLASLPCTRELPPHLTPHDPAALRRARSRLRQVFTLAADNRCDEAAEVLNVLLALTTLRPRLTGNPPQLDLITHPTPGSANVAVTVLSTAVLGVAWEISHHGASRLAECAALGCQQVFVDRSRRGDRRYCSPRCANRTDSAAHRQRRHPDG